MLIFFTLHLTTHCPAPLNTAAWPQSCSQQTQPVTSFFVLMLNLPRWLFFALWWSSGSPRMLVHWPWLDLALLSNPVLCSYCALLHPQKFEELSCLCCVYFHRVSPKNRTQAIRLERKCLYLLSHLTRLLIGHSDRAFIADSYPLSHPSCFERSSAGSLWR